MQKMTLVAATLVLSVASAFAANKAEMKLVNFTGSLTYSLDGKTVTVDAAHPATTIPAGAQITVLSGNATLQSGDTVISADTGDSFSVSTDKKGDVKISASAGTLSVGVGEATASLSKGDAISVAPAKDGSSSLTVTAGVVAINNNGTTQNVAQGGNIAASMTPGDLHDAPNSGSNGGGPKIGGGNGGNGGGSIGGGSIGGGSLGGGSNGSPFQSVKSGLVSKHHP